MKFESKCFVPDFEDDPLTVADEKDVHICPQKKSWRIVDACLDCSLRWRIGEGEGMSWEEEELA